MIEGTAGLAALLLPPDLSPLVAVLLIGLSFITSALTGALGLGGGVLMLAVLATVLPPATVIPVHGVVQIGSNAGRTLLLRASVAPDFVVPFALGSVIGAGLGGLVVMEMPRALLQGLLGLFILWSVWGAKPRPKPLPRPALALIGTVTTFVTMFIGATGPFVASFLELGRLTRHQVVATHGACMCVQHSFKVAAFIILGFAFLPWLPMVALMIGLGFLGTMAGKRFLDRLPQESFARAFKTVLTLLALKLLWDAATAG